MRGAPPELVVKFRCRLAARAWLFLAPAAVCLIASSWSPRVAEALTLSPVVDFEFRAA